MSKCLECGRGEDEELSDIEKMAEHLYCYNESPENEGTLNVAELLWLIHASIVRLTTEVSRVVDVAERGP